MRSSTPWPRRILAGAAVPVTDRAEQTFFGPPVGASLGFNFGRHPQLGQWQVSGGSTLR